MSMDCANCFTCQVCYSCEGACETCQSCYKPERGQGSQCVNCFTCQVCYSCEGACETCQLGYAGEEKQEYQLWPPSDKRWKTEYFVDKTIIARIEKLEKMVEELYRIVKTQSQVVDVSDATYYNSSTTCDEYEAVPKERPQRKRQIDLR